MKDMSKVNDKELYTGRSMGTHQIIKGPGRIDNGRYFIGEKVDGIGYRWYEVFPSSYKKVGGADEK